MTRSENFIQGTPKPADSIGVMMNNEAKIKKVSTNKLNTLLADIGREYYIGLDAGIDAVRTALEATGFDTAELDGIYCGDEGRMNADIGGGRFLSLVWYRMEVTRSYEVTTYAS